MTITIGGPARERAAPQRSSDAESTGSSPTDVPPPIDIAVGGTPLPPEPLSGPSDPPAFAGLSSDGGDAPPLPDEARAAVASAAVATTAPVEATVDQVLHIRFEPGPSERIVAAFRDLRALIKSRPGGTPVVLHIPTGPGRTQEMRLGVGIAYDADLLAEVQRRFGDLLRLELA